MKYLISGLTVAYFSFFSGLPLKAEPNNLPLCYMITSSGRVINLNSLCIQGAINSYYKELEDNAGLTFTNSQFAALKNGMKYSEVVFILGRQGQELSVIETTDDIRATYSWQHRSGAEIRAVFEGGSKVDDRKLVGKRLFQ
ncbi:hypothetical protein [Pseudanabaena mucicola]|uniref:Uncharacterized protein n=1 Tax=Pseudanabaena mucicola FACHB-723 TaxID=2692860 RepID=A0ABR7ZVJ0_9CYAN|nr:hypothetical protein [Pseudanabaena mucicola]MBD2187986.1 hypothetical protein [Pseudanabaena mucicola FACHB-723]